MNRKLQFLLILAVAVSLSLLSACGGGGGGGGTTQTSLTTAVVTISTTGPLATGTQIGGISMTLSLPAGVSVHATADTQNPSVFITDSNVVTATGVTGTQASTLATYSSADRKITIQVYDQDGFTTGEFVTVTCNIASGANPTAGGFTLSDFTAKDINGATINGLTIGFTADIH